jgi:hypothetical protein
MLHGQKLEPGLENYLCTEMKKMKTKKTTTTTTAAAAADNDYDYF